MHDEIYSTKKNKPRMRLGDVRPSDITISFEYGYCKCARNCNGKSDYSDCTYPYSEDADEDFCNGGGSEWCYECGRYSRIDENRYSNEQIGSPFFEVECRYLPDGERFMRLFVCCLAHIIRYADTIHRCLFSHILTAYSSYATLEDISRVRTFVNQIA